MKGELFSLPTKNDYFSHKEELRDLIYELFEHFESNASGGYFTISVNRDGDVNETLEDLLVRMEDALDHDVPYDELEGEEEEEF